MNTTHDDIGGIPYTQAELKDQLISYWVTLQASEPGEMQRRDAEAADYNPWPCNDWRHG
ncbi:MAG: hypothetical protein QF464_01150 [Myxococcota bacterium]|nr:hypothetical protein [Myxococcota bacterium]